MPNLHVFQAAPLARAIEAIVAAGGSEPREAQLVAENLVTANLTGHDSHGIGMIPRYVESLQEGGLQPNRHPQVKFDGGALVALDGQAGYGQVIGLEATAIAIERAKAHGVCVMALANSHHLCRIGQWAEQAVAEGLVSLSFVNVISRSIVAPFGGSDARFGTNPCTIGVPLAGQPPFILDMATSGVAQGKVRVAHNKGEKLPPGLLLDAHGKPTLDANCGSLKVTFPPAKVSSVLISENSSAGSAIKSWSITTRSAHLPGSIDPIIFSFQTCQAAHRV